MLASLNGHLEALTTNHCCPRVWLLRLSWTNQDEHRCTSLELSAMHYAAVSRWQVVQYLVQANADLMITAKDGFDALGRSGDPEIHRFGSLEVLFCGNTSIGHRI